MKRAAPARPRIWLDCDPGHDDALAIISAARYADLVGISTVHGNAPLEKATYNALRVCALLGRRVPVHPGANRPLVAEPITAEEIHGVSGLDGAELPEPSADPEPVNAALAILEASHRFEDLHLVACGPWTNLALALRLDPLLPARLAGVSLMGGSGSFGNTTAAAEFNVLSDPEAAAIVLACGAAPLRMSGLDLTHQAIAAPGFRDQVERAGGPLARAAADWLAFAGGAYAHVFGESGFPVHDVCAVLAITHPHLFEFEARPVEVELNGRHTRGMTLVDWRDRAPDRREPNVLVGRKVDAEGFFAALLEALTPG